MIESLLIDAYPWTRALHLIAVISWMAGIFYLPRLYVYHVEKAGKNKKLDEVFQEMERKLLRVIMNPAMIATWVFGLCLVFTPGMIDWGEIWVWVKAAMVIAMTWYHHLLANWRKAFARGENRRSGRFYRLANEAPTVMMIVIVFMAVGRPF